MRTVQSLISRMVISFTLPLLISALVGCSLLSVPVHAEAGYTQGWMGAPDWSIAWMKSGEFDLPEYIYPKNINATKEVKPTTSSYISNGNSLLTGGSYAEAKQNYESAIKLSPQSFDAWVGRGYALEGLKRSQTALDSYEKAIGFSASTKYAWTAQAGKGRMMSILQRYDDAAEAFRAAIDAFEGPGAGTPEELIKIYLELAEAAQKSGDTEGSSAALSKAEELKDQFDLNSSSKE